MKGVAALEIVDFSSNSSDEGFYGNVGSCDRYTPAAQRLLASEC